MHAPAVRALRHARSCCVPLLAALLAACAGTTAPPAIPDPAFDRDFPDPAVLRAADGAYYAYATQAAVDGRSVNVQVARSHDLANWTHLGDALPVKPRWGATRQKFWAPHVLRDGATYFLYYSAEPDAGGGMCLGVATAAAPEGPFADAGEPLVCGPGILHIDPMAFDDPRTGRRFLYWGSGPIFVQELAPDRLRFAPGSTPRALLHPDPLRPYRRLIEGAWVDYRDGAYFLYFSGDRCCDRDPRYAVMVARAKDPLGPFEEREAPLLEAGGRWLAPGHNSVVADAAGRDWIVYHAIDADRHARRREPGVERVLKVERLGYEDGWPRLARDQPSGQAASPRR